MLFLGAQTSSSAILQAAVGVPSTIIHSATPVSGKSRRSMASVPPRLWDPIPTAVRAVTDSAASPGARLLRDTTTIARSATLMPTEVLIQAHCGAPHVSEQTRRLFGTPQINSLCQLQLSMSTMTRVRFLLRDLPLQMERHSSGQLVVHAIPLVLVSVQSFG